MAAIAEEVHGAEVDLGPVRALLGGQPIPSSHRLSVVLRHAQGGVVREAEVVLGQGVALLGRQPHCWVGERPIPMNAHLLYGHCTRA